jgi:hypothetical protein
VRDGMLRCLLGLAWRGDQGSGKRATTYRSTGVASVPLCTALRMGLADRTDSMTWFLRRYFALVSSRSLRAAAASSAVMSSTVSGIGVSIYYVSV